MNPFANSPTGSDQDSRNPCFLPEVPDLCRIHESLEIERLAEDILCEKYGPEEADSLAAEVEKQKIIDSFVEACSECMDNENFMCDD